MNNHTHTSDSLTSISKHCADLDRIIQAHRPVITQKGTCSMTDFATPWTVNDTATDPRVWTMQNAVDPRMWTILNAENQIVVERLSLNSSKDDAGMLLRHIVRCVNMHDALVDAALGAWAWLDILAKLMKKSPASSDYLPSLQADMQRLESALKTGMDNHATNQQEAS